MKLSVEEEEKIGKPKKKMLNAIECDIRTTGNCVNDVGDWIKWKLWTRVADCKKQGKR